VEQPPAARNQRVQLHEKIDRLIRRRWIPAASPASTRDVLSRFPRMTVAISWALADGFGPWCAWCQKYFAPEAVALKDRQWVRRPQEDVVPKRRLEVHHIVAKRNLSGRLVGVLGGAPTTFDVTFLEEWVVNAHEECHRGARLDDYNLQKAADNAANNLEWILDAARGLRTESNNSDFEVLDASVLKAFESGRYAIALFLNEVVRAARDRREEEAASLETLAHQLSARSGIAGKQPLDLRTFAGGYAARNGRSLLHIASHHAQVGNYASARATLEYAESLILSGQSFDLDLALRRAQVNRSLSDAATALRLARDVALPYREDTALVVAGSIALANDPAASRDYFDAVLAPGRNPSWLYRAEAWFGLGCSALRERRPADAYRYLVAAEYVHAVLGLQPMPHPDLAEIWSGDALCTPSEALAASTLSMLSKSRRESLRVAAIVGGSIRTALMQDIGTLPLAGSTRPDPLREPE
jgi:hypothetical protein